jgi:dTDP-4-amino-4,6-dideoxygalactose transaminase
VRAIRPDASLDPARWLAAWRARRAGPEAALGIAPAGDACRFVGSATEALSLAIDAAPGGLTLLPDYLCPLLTRSLMACGDEIQTFPVDERLHPDWEWIAGFRPGVPKKVVVVHYYGIVQTIPEALRARDDLTFIEDAAHALWSAGVGDQGRMTAFSFRKFMPVSDGGALVAREPTERADPALTGAGWRPYASAAYLTLSWLESRCMPWLRARMLERPALAHAWEDTTDRPVQPRALSPLGRRLAAAARPGTWAARRRAHWAAYDGLLPADDERLRRVFPTLPSGAVPYGFPVLVSERERVRRHLLRAGVQARSSWDRLVQGGPAARAIASSILLLPLHQGLDANDIERVAATVAVALDEAHAPTHH